MPIVRVSGKVKRFPYTKKGKQQASKLAKKAGVKLETSSSKRYGISNLKYKG